MDAPELSSVSTLFQFSPLREGRRSTVNDGWTVKLFQFSPLREGRRRRDAPVDQLPANFNSRPCERGDLLVAQHLDGPKFQFSPLREGRRLQHLHVHTALYFNSRPCERGDKQWENGGKIDGLFQFSPLREGRRRADGDACADCYFNSRPCERGDARRCRGSRRMRISILAPARGATQAWTWASATALFQFSPLREGRREVAPRRRNSGNFNSRPCERGDPIPEMPKEE